METEEITCYNCGFTIEYEGTMDAVRCPECLEWTWTRDYPPIDSNAESAQYEQLRLAPQ